MDRLIALTTVVALVDGVRTELPPGTDVTDILAAHDRKALLEMNAVVSEAAWFAKREAEIADRAESAATFAAARARVRAEQASTAVATLPIAAEPADAAVTQEGGDGVDQVSPQTGGEAAPDAAINGASGGDQATGVVDQDTGKTETAAPAEAPQPETPPATTAPEKPARASKSTRR